MLIWHIDMIVAMNIEHSLTQLKKSNMELGFSTHAGTRKIHHSCFDNLVRRIFATSLAGATIPTRYSWRIAEQDRQNCMKFGTAQMDGLQATCSSFRGLAKRHSAKKHGNGGDPSRHRAEPQLWAPTKDNVQRDARRVAPIYASATPTGAI